MLAHQIPLYAPTVLHIHVLYACNAQNKYAANGPLMSGFIVYMYSCIRGMKLGRLTDVITSRDTITRTWHTVRLIVLEIVRKIHSRVS